MTWTYFVQAAAGGPIKIGFTSRSDPEERLAGLQTGSPVELRIIGLISGNVEASLHSKFASLRLHGEWFAVDRELLSYISDHAQAGFLGYARRKATLKLEGEAVHVLEAMPDPLDSSFFDRVIPNDDDVWMNLCNALDWNDGVVFEEDDEEAPWLAVSDMASLIEGQEFVHSIGINEGRGLVGFMCGELNSGVRHQLLMSLGALASDVDCATGAWSFFAFFWEGGRRLGVCLTVLSYFELRECAFDLIEALRVEDEVSVGFCGLAVEVGSGEDELWGEAGGLPEVVGLEVDGDSAGE